MLPCVLFAHHRCLSFIWIAMRISVIKPTPPHMQYSMGVCHGEAKSYGRCTNVPVPGKMVVLPPSNRRPASTLMPVRFHDLWGVLEGARSTRRDVIDPSIRSRSIWLSYFHNCISLFPKNISSVYLNFGMSSRLNWSEGLQNRSFVSRRDSHRFSALAR